MISLVFKKARRAREALMVFWPKWGRGSAVSKETAYR